MKAVVAAEQKQVATTAAGLGEVLIERFKKSLTVKPSSVATYLKGVNALLKWLHANNIKSPTREDLTGWLNDLAAAGRKGTTIKIYLVAVQLFFRWLSHEGLYPNVADHLKLTGEKAVEARGNDNKDSLTPEQCAALVANVKGNTSLALRNRAILMLMLTCGLRTIEVCRANVGDLRNIGGKTFIPIHGKGGKTKDGLVPTQVHAAINAYLQTRKNLKANDPLFVSLSRSNFGARLQTQTISKLVKKNLRDIDLDSPRLTAHSLRHTTATILIDNLDIGLDTAKMVMRHENVSTTLIYLDKKKRAHCTAEQALADLIFAGSGARRPSRFGSSKGRTPMKRKGTRRSSH